jgi:hypothetical protein
MNSAHMNLTYQREAPCRLAAAGRLVFSSIRGAGRITTSGVAHASSK